MIHHPRQSLTIIIPVPRVAGVESEVQVRRNEAGQRVVRQTSRGDVVAVDSAYDVAPANRDRDVVVNASYSGVLPARFLAAQRPRGVIGLDCGVGPAGAAVAGLWFLEALDLPAATADVRDVLLGDGADVYQRGRISFANQPARDRGVRPGQAVAEAAALLLDGDPSAPVEASAVTNRAVLETHPSGRAIVRTDSIAFGLPEDRGTNVLVTAGHTGRSALPYLRKVRPHAFICSDGGMGRDGSGAASLPVMDDEGVPGATVDATRARMGDAASSWEDGVVSAANRLAEAAGVRVGMRCAEAARLLLAWEGAQPWHEHDEREETGQ